MSAGFEGPVSHVVSPAAEFAAGPTPRLLVDTELETSVVSPIFETVLQMETDSVQELAIQSASRLAPKDLALTRDTE